MRERDQENLIPEATIVSFVNSLLLLTSVWCGVLFEIATGQANRAILAAACSILLLLGLLSSVALVASMASRHIPKKHRSWLLHLCGMVIALLFVGALVVALAV